MFRELLYLCVFAIILSSCTGLSKLTEGQYLVTKNQLSLEDKSKIANYKKINNQLNDELRPKPNGKLLWMRPALAFHNTISEPKKEKGFRHWLKYKVGKGPVLLDKELCENLNLTFENRLYHKGHFNANSRFEIELKKKTAKIKFTIDAKEGFTIDTLILPEANDSLSIDIHEIHKNSLIKENALYDLDIFKAERERIDNALKDLGYYYFNPDYLLFLADTISGNHNVTLKLVYKNEMPVEAERIYSIDKIFLAEDFKLENYHPDTIEYDDYNIITSSNYMKPKIYLNSILTEKGDIYNKSKHTNSLKQLMGLRSYKFANARYTPSANHKDKLDINYFTTPSQKMSLSAEINVVSKSNNFAGPGVILSFKSRNTFHGAELFSLNLRGRFEKQISGDKQGDTAYEISTDASLDLPRLIPFKMQQHNKPYLPNAKINLGAGIFARVSLYKFNTYSTGLTYTWRKNKYLTHVFQPIDISVTNLLDATDEFKLFLLYNPSIRKSFEEQFIIGSAYNFIINKLSNENKSQYYINAGVDPSGNMVVLLSNLVTGSKDSDEQVTVFGSPVSQYFRIRTDFRYYIKTGKESRIATRLYAGVGVPYGNSTVMPYVKQFYAGGTNSMRAFRARSLGPGSYDPDEDLENVLVDQTGEIKLETNIEYRFPIAGFLKGALFTDIGNIWLVNADSLRPGGEFELENFHKELAVGFGLGLRIDVDIVVLRFDWAFPARKPSEPEGERWVLDDIDLFSRQWRKDNLLWNISIGYPF